MLEQDALNCPWSTFYLMGGLSNFEFSVFGLRRMRNFRNIGGVCIWGMLYFWDICLEQLFIPPVTFARIRA